MHIEREKEREEVQISINYLIVCNSKNYYIKNRLQVPKIDIPVRLRKL